MTHSRCLSNDSITSLSSNLSLWSAVSLPCESTFRSSFRPTEGQLRWAQLYSKARAKRTRRMVTQLMQSPKIPRNEEYSEEESEGSFGLKTLNDVSPGRIALLRASNAAYRRRLANSEGWKASYSWDVEGRRRAYESMPSPTDKYAEKCASRQFSCPPTVQFTFDKIEPKQEAMSIVCNRDIFQRTDLVFSPDARGYGTYKYISPSEMTMTGNVEDHTETRMAIQATERPRHRRWKSEGMLNVPNNENFHGTTFAYSPTLRGNGYGDTSFPMTMTSVNVKEQKRDEGTIEQKKQMISLHNDKYEFNDAIHDLRSEFKEGDILNDDVLKFLVFELKEARNRNEVLSKANQHLREELRNEKNRSEKEKKEIMAKNIFLEDILAKTTNECLATKNEMMKELEAKEKCCFRTKQLYQSNATLRHEMQKLKMNLLHTESMVAAIENMFKVTLAKNLKENDVNEKKFWGGKKKSMKEREVRKKKEFEGEQMRNEIEKYKRNMLETVSIIKMIDNAIAFEEAYDEENVDGKNSNLEDNKLFLLSKLKALTHHLGDIVESVHKKGSTSVDLMLLLNEERNVDERKSKSSNESIESIRKEYETLQNKLHDSENNIKVLKSKHKKELHYFEREKRSFRDINLILQLQIAALRKELEKYKKRADSNSLKIKNDDKKTSSTEDNQQMKGAIESVREEAKFLKSELINAENIVQVKTSELPQEKKQLEDDRNSFEDSKLSLQDEIDDLNNRTETIEQDFEEEKKLFEIERTNLLNQIRTGKEALLATEKSIDGMKFSHVGKKSCIPEKRTEEQREESLAHLVESNAEGDKYKDEVKTRSKKKIGKRTTRCEKSKKKLKDENDVEKPFFRLKAMH